MKLEVLKCPSCGANIEFEEGVESCECEYCGAKVTVAPSENKNNVADVLKKFAPPVNKPTSVKSNDNSTEVSPIRKIINFLFNALFIINILLAGLGFIMAIAEADVFSVFLAFFFLIYAIMFKVIALTPKGSKHILGKEKGLKLSYFILICVMLSLALIILSPTA